MQQHVLFVTMKEPDYCLCFKTWLCKSLRVLDCLLCENRAKSCLLKHCLNEPKYGNSGLIWSSTVCAGAVSVSECCRLQFSHEIRRVNFVICAESISRDGVGSAEGH